MLKRESNFVNFSSDLRIDQGNGLPYLFERRISSEVNRKLTMIPEAWPEVWPEVRLTVKSDVIGYAWE